MSIAESTKQNPTDLSNQLIVSVDQLRKTRDTLHNSLINIRTLEAQVKRIPKYQAIIKTQNKIITELLIYTKPPGYEKLLERISKRPHCLKTYNIKVPYGVEEKVSAKKTKSEEVQLYNGILFSAIQFLVIDAILKPDSSFERCRTHSRTIGSMTKDMSVLTDIFDRVKGSSCSLKTDNTSYGTLSRNCTAIDGDHGDVVSASSCGVSATYTSHCPALKQINTCNWTETDEFERTPSIKIPILNEQRQQESEGFFRETKEVQNSSRTFHQSLPLMEKSNLCIELRDKNFGSFSETKKTTVCGPRKRIEWPIEQIVDHYQRVDYLRNGSAHNFEQNSLNISNSVDLNDVEDH